MVFFFCQIERFLWEYVSLNEQYNHFADVVSMQKNLTTHDLDIEKLNFWFNDTGIRFARVVYMVFFGRLGFIFSSSPIIK